MLFKQFQICILQKGVDNRIYSNYFKWKRRKTWFPNGSSIWTIGRWQKVCQLPISLLSQRFCKNTSAYTKDSPGVLYIKPLGFSSNTKIFSSSARVVSLTPAGISTNEVLCHLISDILEGSINGITEKYPYGFEIAIFFIQWDSLLTTRRLLHFGHFDTYC